MKVLVFLGLFILGFILGRWTAPRPVEHVAKQEASVEENSTLTRSSGMPQANADLKSKGDSTANEMARTTNPEELNKNAKTFLRTEEKNYEKKIRVLFDQLLEANQKNEIELQNKLLAEMENLDPKNEKVFQAKALFLEEDEDWKGAQSVYKDCVTVNPNSLVCLRRLTNIRSSTLDEKIFYGQKCLEIDKEEAMCLVDLGIALRSKGDFLKSKLYFETALNLPTRGEGFNREYVLYQYGITLEGLDMIPAAKKAYAEACRLKFKPACELLK